MDFSVTMCVYGGDNAENFRLAVQSVLNNTLPPSELVLVVDGPVPSDLQAVIDEVSQNSIAKTYVLEKNVGHGRARKEAFRHLCHDWVAVMDSDDICCPDRFEKQVAYIEAHPEVSVVGGNIEEFIDGTGEIAGRRIVPQEHEQILKYLKKRCPFNHMSVMYRRRDIEEVGGYKDWYMNEDYYLWIRMALHGCKFHNLPDILVKVRVGADMYQRRGGWRYFVSEYRIQKLLLQEHINGIGRFLVNNSIRLIVQVLMPNALRGWFFQKFARNKKA